MRHWCSPPETRGATSPTKPTTLYLLSFALRTILFVSSSSSLNSRGLQERERNRQWIPAINDRWKEVREVRAERGRGSAQPRSRRCLVWNPKTGILWVYWVQVKVCVCGPHYLFLTFKSEMLPLILVGIRLFLPTHHSLGTSVPTLSFKFSQPSPQILTVFQNCPQQASLQARPQKVTTPTHCPSQW